MDQKIKIEHKGMALEIERMDTQDAQGKRGACYTISASREGQAPSKEYIYFENTEELQTFAEMLVEYVAHTKE